MANVKRGTKKTPRRTGKQKVQSKPKTQKIKPLTEEEEIELLVLKEMEARLEIPPIFHRVYDHYRYKMLYGGRGSGKSWTAAKFFIEKLTESKKKLVVAREIAASISDSIGQLLIDTIIRLGAPGWTVTKKEIRNANGSKIIFRGLKDARAARSTKGIEDADYLLLEEASDVSMESLIFVYPTIRKKGSEIWALFNRYSDFDPIYELFCITADPNILVIEANWRDNPFFTDENRADMERDKARDYDLYLHVWEGQPIAQLEKAVMPRSIVLAAMERKIKVVNQIPIIGADIARYGSDRIQFYKRIGMKVVDSYTARKQSTVDTSRDLAAFAESKYATILIDDTGVGGGVTDNLIDWGFQNVIPINFGGKPKDDSRYDSVASEMWFETREALEEAEIPNDKVLREELTGRLFKYDRRQRRCIESKDEFKKRFKRSCDAADALILTFYTPGTRLILPDDIKNQIKERRTNSLTKRKGRLIV